MKLAKVPLHAQNCVDKVNSAAVDNKSGSAKALERRERKPAIDAKQSGARQLQAQCRRCWLDVKRGDHSNKLHNLDLSVALHSRAGLQG